MKFLSELVLIFLCFNWCLCDSNVSETTSVIEVTGDYALVTEEALVTTEVYVNTDNENLVIYSEQSPTLMAGQISVDRSFVIDPTTIASTNHEESQPELNSVTENISDEQTQTGIRSAIR